jgi:hypothetical protein
MPPLGRTTRDLQARALDEAAIARPTNSSAASGCRSCRSTRSSACVYLMIDLPGDTRLRFVAWLIACLLIRAFYDRK